MTDAVLTTPGLYAKPCHFDGCPVLALFNVTQAQLTRWRELAREVSRLGGLEISLGEAPHPGFALAIEGQGFEAEQDLVRTTGWDAGTVQAILQNDAWTRVDVDEPDRVLAELYARRPDPEVFELFQLDLMRVNAHGYVQPTAEQEDDDRLIILSPIFPLEQAAGEVLRVVYVAHGSGTTVREAA